MEFGSANTKEELPLTLLKIKNIELENNLLLEKQKYILLQSELESVRLIASKQVDVYKSECMRLKEIILMLENDYNSFKTKVKNQEVVKNVCRKIKKVGEIACFKHEKLEKNGTERGKNYSNESELRNRSVIVSDDYVQLTSKFNSGIIGLKNNSRFQMEMNIPFESLPFCEVESLRRKEKSVEIADVVNNPTFTKLYSRRRGRGRKLIVGERACVREPPVYALLDCQNFYRRGRRSRVLKSSKDKSEADENEHNDDKGSDKDNESDGDEEIKQSKSKNKNKLEKNEQEKNKQIIDQTSEEMKGPKKVKASTENNSKTTAVNSPTGKTKANGRNDSGEVFVRNKKIADPTTKNSMLKLKATEDSSSKWVPKASKPEPKEKPVSKSKFKGALTSKVESNDVVNGDGEKVINKTKYADSPKSTLTSEIKEKSISKLEQKVESTSTSEPKVKSAANSTLERPSTLNLESKDESVSKPESKEKPRVKRSSGGSKEPEMLGKLNPSKEELRITICNILKKVDFDTMTITDVFKQVDARYKTDLTSWKAYIGLMIQEELIKLADKHDDEEKSYEEEKAHKPEAKRPKLDCIL